MTTAELTKEEQEIVKAHDELEKDLKAKVTFVIHTPLLQSLISQVERAAAKLAVVDIMKGIYIYVDEDKLTLRAVNNEFGTEITVKQESVIEGKKKIKNFEITEGKPGGFVVLQKNFKAMINKLPRKTATISIDGSTALIKSGSTKYNLLVLDALEFPAFPDVDKSNALHLQPEQLIESYDSTAYAIASKHTKPSLTGLNHRIDGNKLFFTATDGHQLSRVSISLNEEVEIEDGLDFTIPSKSVDEIRRQAKTSETVTIMVDKSNAIFEFDNVVMFSRVFEEKYPDVNKLIPTEFTTEIRFTARELQDMIDRSLLLCEGTTATAAMRTIPELRQMRLSSHEDGVGFFEEDLGATEGAGAPVHIGINLRFFNEAIKVHAPGQLLKIQLLGSLKPFIISRADQEDDDNINFILPIRLTSYEETVKIENFNAPVQIEAEYDLGELEEDEDQAIEVVAEETAEAVTEEVVEAQQTEETVEEVVVPQINPFANLGVKMNEEDEKNAEESEEIPVDPNQENAFAPQD